MEKIDAIDAAKNEMTIPGFQIAIGIKLIVLQSILYGKIFAGVFLYIKATKPFIGTHPDITAGRSILCFVFCENAVDNVIGKAVFLTEFSKDTGFFIQAIQATSLGTHP